MNNCTLDCIEMIGNFSQPGMCSFAQQYCVQDTVQIVQGYYCLINSSLMILTIFSVCMIILEGHHACHGLLLDEHRHR